MLSILINAYACSPDMGSEPGMAWNWCVNLAKYCELHIITEGEFRERIEAVLPTLTQGKNMHFYWNPIGGDDDERCAKIRRMCWNQGDWRFYKYYRKWQWRTYELGKDICAQRHIDILHQLNMIGFREPGYLWKLDGVPFVWGPIGGLKQFPMCYADGGGLKMKLFNGLKNIINIWQLKYDVRVSAALHNAALLISSIPDSYTAIKKYHNLESHIIPETGCFENKECLDRHRDFYDKYLKIIWVGKFDFRKRLDIALETMATVCNSNIVFQIFGTGSERQVNGVRSYCDKLGISDWVLIKWMGNCPNDEIQKAMSGAHLFFFTSISEDTSTVVMEAISNSLPVLCFDTCGMGYVINDKVGIKVPLTNPRQSVKDFADKIEYLYSHRDVLKRMSDNCFERRTELSWDSKACKMVELYNQIVKQ